MAELEFSETFAHPVAALWAIVGTLDRVDWVPSVARAELRGDERHMHMDGAGALVEKIFLHDTENHRIEYGVIDSAVGLTHHRATLQLTPEGDGCRLDWHLSIEPDAFAEPVGQTMQACLGELHRLLGSR